MTDPSQNSKPESSYKTPPDSCSQEVDKELKELEELMRDFDDNDVATWTLYHRTQEAATELKKAEREDPRGSDYLRSLEANFRRHRRSLLHEVDTKKMTSETAKEPNKIAPPSEMEVSSRPPAMQQ
ncbi:MAG: hypothetical protein Q9172_002048 [Xanthocarpia lactea]